jgi:hypothetical protein
VNWIDNVTINLRVVLKRRPFVPILYCNLPSGKQSSDDFPFPLIQVKSIHVLGCAIWLSSVHTVCSVPYRPALYVLDVPYLIVLRYGVLCIHMYIPPRTVPNPNKYIRRQSRRNFNRMELPDDPIPRTEYRYRTPPNAQKESSPRTGRTRRQ